MQNDWEPEIKEEDVSKLDDSAVDKLKHMYAEVDKYLVYLLDGVTQIDNKTSILLGFQITIILGLITFAFSNNRFVIPSIFAILIGLISLYFSWRAYRLQNIQAPGNIPKNYLTKECLIDKGVENLLFEDIESYQSRINLTHDLISSKGRNFNNAIIMLISVPAIFILVEILRLF